MSPFDIKWLIHTFLRYVGYGACQTKTAVIESYNSIHPPKLISNTLSLKYHIWKFFENCWKPKTSHDHQCKKITGWLGSENHENLICVRVHNTSNKLRIYMYIILQFKTSVPRLIPLKYYIDIWIYKFFFLPVKTNIRSYLRWGCIVS